MDLTLHALRPFSGVSIFSTMNRLCCCSALDSVTAATADDDVAEDLPLPAHRLPLGLTAAARAVTGLALLVRLGPGPHRPQPPQAFWPEHCDSKWFLQRCHVLLLAAAPCVRVQRAVLSQRPRRRRHGVSLFIITRRTSSLSVPHRPKISSITDLGTWQRT